MLAPALIASGMLMSDCGYYERSNISSLVIDYNSLFW
jgi:hypothetical protein